MFFDGACPLCSREIAHYQRLDKGASLCFIDVATAGAPTPPGVNQQQALARFHVTAADGRVLSGADAFMEVWAQLPGWRWLGRLARLPGGRAILEVGYRLALPVRPYVARLLKPRPASTP